MIFAGRRGGGTRSFLLVGVAALCLAAPLLIFAIDRRGAAPDEQVLEHVEAGHIHGLGVNPRDGALFVATHTGLFRVDRATKQATRTSDSHQDTMGFAVVGADHMIGSGHPDVRTGLPPLLGLIESRDAGETWTPISLLGNADFHALRAVGDAIVGYDATNQRIMASRDGGRSWQERRVSEPLIDLVAARSGRVLIAATATQLRRSGDGGRTWSGISEAPGLLAWPRPNRLFLLTGDGRLWRSPDQGRRWEHLSEIGGRPTAFAVTGEAMYVALLDGSIQHSVDGGRSWELLTRLT